MSYITMVVVTFMVFVGMGSAVDFQVSMGNGQESSSVYMGGYSRFNPSVYEESMFFDFSGNEKHMGLSINMETDNKSSFVSKVNSTVTMKGDINHVKGVYTSIYETDVHYEQTYNSRTYEVL